MTYQKLPMLGMDGVLCDRPQDGCFIGGKRNYARDKISNTTKKETTKVKTELSANQLSHYIGIRIRNPAAADRYWARCMGQDSAMDDETIEKLKSFLQSKLHPSDHAAACALMDGGEAEDTELPENAGKALPKKTPAEDARVQADFFQRFPGLAAIKIDNSGIPIPRRPAKPHVAMDAASAASFFERFPDAAKIKLL